MNGPKPRPTKAENQRRLSERGETVESFVIREATPADADAVAHLHVATFIETHGGPGPSYQTREWQWRGIIGKQDPSDFCFVIARPDGELVGFARGVPYTDELPGFSGELNKIYLLQEYQRLGLGRRLVCRVAQRFLSQGIDSMLLFGEASNPSNAFYEALDAERLITSKGEFHGGYGWRDLRVLC